MGTERTEKPAFRIRGMVRAAVMLGAGLAVGVIIRFFDLYTTNLGNMFSELSVWVFLGTVIAWSAAGHRSRLLELYLASASECLPPITPLPG